MIFWIRKDFRNKKKAYILKIGANSFGEVTSFWTQIAADWMDLRRFRLALTTQENTDLHRLLQIQLQLWIFAVCSGRFCGNG